MFRTYCTGHVVGAGFSPSESLIREEESQEAPCDLNECMLPFCIHRADHYFPLFSAICAVPPPPATPLLLVLGQLLLPILSSSGSGQQSTSGPFSFEELTTWTFPSTGFSAVAAAAAAMRLNARFKPTMKLTGRHRRRPRLLPSAQVPPPPRPAAEMPPASSSSPAAVSFPAAAGIRTGMDYWNYSGNKLRNAQVSFHSSSSSEGHHHPRYNFRYPRKGAGMADDSSSPPGELGRNRDYRTTQRQPSPPPAHRSPPGIFDRARLPGHSDVAWFRVTETTRLGISRGDITTWSIDGETDAIVNAANERMLGGGGVDGAIHRRAGPRLRQACERFQPIKGVRCPVGKAKLTDGFDLPALKVIHTVGPRYGQDPNPAELLRDSYLNSLEAAVMAGIKFIAFPAISCGIYAYPLEEAAEVSLDAIKQAPETLSEIHFIHFEGETFKEWMKVAEREFPPIHARIDPASQQMPADGRVDSSVEEKSHTPEEEAGGRVDSFVKEKSHTSEEENSRSSPN